MNITVSHQSEVPWPLLRRLGEGRLSPAELEVVTALAQREPIAPPASVVARALAICRSEDRQGKRGGVARLLGLLTFDSGLQTVRAGIRSAATPGRQLLYTVPAGYGAGNHSRLTVQLEIAQESSGMYRLSGAIGAEAPDTSFQLVLEQQGASAPVARVTPSALGYFTFADLVLGTYLLTVREGDAEVQIGPLDF